MFVMALMLSLGFCVSAFATDDQYTKNLIPVMTSNTTPNGVATASTEYFNGMYPAWKAFNGSNTVESDAWLTDKSGSGWLKYQFDNPKKICKYTVSNEKFYSISTQSAPKEWTFEASNDGANWIALDTRTNETDWTEAQKREYTFTNNTSYLYYRINISANNGYSWLAIGELEMMEKVQTNSVTLNKITDSINIAQIDNLTATTTPAGAEVVWSSSDSAIATVDSTGKVTAIKEGQATITAQIKGSETKATCVVTVTKSGTTTPTEPNTPTGTGLFIELVDGNIKQYDVSSDEINKFINWYKARDNDKSQVPYYKFTKGTYTDYVIHDKIDWFEVRY